MLECLDQEKNKKGKFFKKIFHENPDVIVRRS